MLCALMVLNLCLAADGLVSAGVERSIALVGRARYAAFEVETGGTDLVAFPRRSALARACADRACVSYHQYCGAAGEARYCQLQIAGPTGGYQRVTIRAASPEAVAAGRRSLAYGYRQGNRTMEIPLSLMTAVSDDPRPPRCETRRCR